MTVGDCRVGTAVHASLTDDRGWGSLPARHKSEYTAFGIVTFHCDALHVILWCVLLAPVYRVRLVNSWYWYAVTLTGALTFYSALREYCKQLLV